MEKRRKTQRDAVFGFFFFLRLFTALLLFALGCLLLACGARLKKKIARRGKGFHGGTNPNRLE